jgi:glycyl-tRNA synthetase (class II)
MMNPEVWRASGHLGGFSDPLMDCRECKERFRADKLIEDWCAENDFTLPKPIDAFSQQEMKEFVAASMARHKVPRYIDFVDSFPMNAAGKILKYKMREAAEEKIKAMKGNG